MTTLLLCLSDSHAGHKLGLLAPGVNLFDEGPDGEITQYQPTLGAVQEWLWFDCYIAGLEKVTRIAPGADIVLMHMGDMTHGNRHPEQVISTRQADQIIIANANLNAAMRLPGLRAARFVFGTGTHEFGEGSAALLVQNYMALTYPHINTKPLYHGLANIDGALIDYAHHGPGPGQRRWLQGNVARFYLRDIMLGDIENGVRPPDLVLRGHVHTYVNEWLEHGGHESRLVILPPLCGLGDYGRMVTKSVSRISAGIVAFVLDGGRVVDYTKHLQTVDLRTEETI